MNSDSLILEKNEPFRKILKTVLERLGLTVLTPGGIARCREMLAVHRPGLVLIDPALPGSQDVVGEIRSEYPETQVLVLVPCDAGPETTKRIKGSGDDVIVMPPDPHLLEMTLKRALAFGRLSRRLEKIEADVEAAARKRAARMVADERYVTARQIVDETSLFVDRIVEEVQGDIPFFNQMPYFISIHDRDMRVLATNSTYRHHFGNRTSQPSWSIYTGRHASRSTCPVGQTVESVIVMSTRARVRYKSGVELPVIVHTSPIYNNDGEIDLVLEVFAGIKETQQLAAEIRTTQQRYQRLFDAVPSFIAVLDQEMRITAANQRFKAVFGDHTGEKFWGAFRRSDTARYTCPATRTIKDGTAHQSEMVLTTRDGEVYNTMAWSAPIHTAAGQLLQVLMIFLDVTEIRRLKDHLSELGLMIGELSHNLKGCLTGLDAGLYLVDTGFYRNRPGRIEEGLGVTRLMVERIKKQVTDILYYAKERPLEPRNVDVMHFAANVAANMEQRVRAANIRFSCNFIPSLLKFQIDTTLVRTALVNILENAIEACIEDVSEKSHRIEFTVRPKGNSVVFYIEDTGVGMDAADLKNIFTLFYSSKGRKGTGLGLFITRKIIKKHGGRISVKSEPGKGTRFRIRLPVKLPAARFNGAGG